MPERRNLYCKRRACPMVFLCLTHVMDTFIFLLQVTNCFLREIRNRLVFKIHDLMCKAHKHCQWKASSPPRVVCALIYGIHSLMLKSRNFTICIFVAHYQYVFLTYTDVFLTSLQMHFKMNSCCNFRPLW